MLLTGNVQLRRAAASMEGSVDGVMGWSAERANAGSAQVGREGFSSDFATSCLIRLEPREANQFVNPTCWSGAEGIGGQTSEQVR